MPPNLLTTVVLQYTRLMVAILLIAWPLSFLHRELGALRNWQIAFNATLFLWAVRYAWLRREVPFSPDDHFEVPIWLRRAFLAAAFVWCLARPLSQFWAFEVSGADFSIFERMLWNTLHGRFMYSQVYDVNHFGVHQHYGLFALLPVYALIPSPYTLLVAGAVAMWAALFPLWKLGLHFFHNEWFVVLLVFAYLGSPWFAWLLDGGFRPEMAYPATAFMFLLGWVKRTPRLWVPGLLLFLACREDVALYTFAFGVAAGVSERRREGIFVATISAALFAVNMFAVRPAMFGDAPPTFVSFWGAYGATFGEVAQNMLGQPLRVAGDVLSSRWYLLLGPALLLPLLSPRALGASMPGLVLFGTANTGLREYRGYGIAVLLPFVLLGVLDGTARLRTWLGPTPQKWAALVALLLFPIVGAGQVWFPKPRYELLEARAEFVRSIRQERQPLCVQFSLYPHIPCDVDAQPLYECWKDDGMLLVLHPKTSIWPLTPKIYTALENRLRQNGAVLPGGFLVGRKGPN